MKKVLSILLVKLLSFGAYGLTSCNNKSEGTSINNQEQVLKIGSFNIAAARQVNKDLKVLAEDVIQQGLDIVGFQEVDFNASRSNYVDFMKELSEHTGYKYYQFFEALDFQSFYSPSTGSYGIGILSKYPIKSTENIRLTEPDKSKKLEGRTLGRAVIEVNGKEINFFTTHLSFLIADARETEFKRLNTILSKYQNVILTGDFNNHDLSEFDALTNLSKVNNPDNPFETYPEGHGFIDNIIYDNNFEHIKGSEGIVVSDHSDHYMFYAKLRIK